MAFFPPVPPPPQEPPPPPPGRDDDWRHSGRGFRVPELSVGKIILGMIAVLVFASIGSCLLVRGAQPSFEAVILAPRDGDTLPRGPLLVRIRTSQSFEWELYYARPGADYERLDQGTGSVIPGGQLGGGTRFVEADEPGIYRIRLVARRSDGEETVATSEVTIE